MTAKYKWQAWTVYGGYAWLKQADPNDRFPDGFRTIGGWNVPATIPSTFPDAKNFWPTQWINYTNYAVPRIAPYFWLGAKYAITPQLDVTGAFYYLQQSDYNTDPPAPAPSPHLSNQTAIKSPLRASTAAIAPARKTSFRRSSTIGRSSASTSTLA